MAASSSWGVAFFSSWRQTGHCLEFVNIIQLISLPLTSNSLKMFSERSKNVLSPCQSHLIQYLIHCMLFSGILFVAIGLDWKRDIKAGQDAIRQRGLLLSFITKLRNSIITHCLPAFTLQWWDNVFLLGWRKQRLMSWHYLVENIDLCLWISLQLFFEQISSLIVFNFH